MSNIGLGRTLLHKYRLERELASGGMGALWLGVDVELGRRVAIKFIRTPVGSDVQMRARFEREARAAARIRSTHVIETYEYGVDRGCPFIVMEYLDGEDLNSLLNREGKLSVARSVKILMQIAKALDAIHGVGVVHRDLKPGNVFLTNVNRAENAKVLDFGIAKSASGTFKKLTSSGMMLGTPKYMSPEQVRSPMTVDHRTDHWSAAVILYRMLTGCCPFTGSSAIDLVNRICNSTFPKASDLAPELPPGIDRFFARAFAVNRDDRFESGRQMLIELQRATAERDPSSERTRNHGRLEATMQDTPSS